MNARIVKQITWNGNNLATIRRMLSYIPRPLLALQYGDAFFILEEPVKRSDPNKLIATRVPLGWACELKELAGDFSFHVYPLETE